MRADRAEREAPEAVRVPIARAAAAHRTHRAAAPEETEKQMVVLAAAAAAVLAVLVEHLLVELAGREQDRAAAVDLVTRPLVLPALAALAAPIINTTHRTVPAEAEAEAVAQT